MRAWFATAFIIGSVWATAAAASELEALCKKGYAVVDTTELIDSNFEGCKINKRIALKNGLTFVCSSYSYVYAYNPEVLILQNINSKDVKVMIDDEEFDGTLYRSS